VPKVGEIAAYGFAEKSEIPKGADGLESGMGNNPVSADAFTTGVNPENAS